MFSCDGPVRPTEWWSRPFETRKLTLGITRSPWETKMGWVTFWLALNENKWTLTLGPLDSAQQGGSASVRWRNFQRNHKSLVRWCYSGRDMDCFNGGLKVQALNTGLHMQVYPYEHQSTENYVKLRSNYSFFALRCEYSGRDAKEKQFCSPLFTESHHGY